MGPAEMNPETASGNRQSLVTNLSHDPNSTPLLKNEKGTLVFEEKATGRLAKTKQFLATVFDVRNKYDFKTNVQRLITKIQAAAKDTGRDLGALQQEMEAITKTIDAVFEEKIAHSWLKRTKVSLEKQKMLLHAAVNEVNRSLPVTAESVTAHLLDLLNNKASNPATEKAWLRKHNKQVGKLDLRSLPSINTGSLKLVAQLFPPPREIILNKQAITSLLLDSEARSDGNIRAILTRNADKIEPFQLKDSKKSIYTTFLDLVSILPTGKILLSPTDWCTIRQEQDKHPEQTKEVKEKFNSAMNENFNRMRDGTRQENASLWLAIADPSISRELQDALRKKMVQ